MAEKKQITTRIALKNDLSSKWESSSLIALAGEYLFDNERKYIKVGDGTKTWKELDTIHIPVSAVDGLADVDKDTIYDISADGTKVTLISADSRIKNPTWGEVRSWDISGLIATQVEAEKTRATEAESHLLDATQANTEAIGAEETRAKDAEESLDGRISTIEGDYLKAADKTELEGKISAEETRAKGVEKELSDAIDNIAGDYATKEEVNTISTLLSTDVKTNREAIATLNGAVTVEGSVAKSIKDAIDALNVDELTVGPDETIKSIKEENGKIVVEKQSIQLSGTDQVTGLDDKLSNNLTALTQEIDDRKAADTALSNDYNEKIDDIKAKYALSADVTAISNDLGTKIANEETRAKDAEEDLDGRLDVIEGEETVNGSIKKALKDAKDYANSLCADLSTTADAKFVKRADVNQEITDDNKVATMADIVGLSGVVHFRGASETFDGTEAKPRDTEWYTDHEPVAGDIVINSKTSKEYLYDGSKWLELGDEGLYVKNTFKLNGHELSGDTLDLVGSDIKVGGIYADKNVDEALDQLSADAKAYTDASISALDVEEITVGAAKTIASISETDGKIAVVTADIQIAEDQVTDLTSDLKTLSDMISAEADAREESDSAICAIVAAEVGRAKDAEAELSGKITDMLDDAKAYTNEVSAALSTDYVGKIATAKSEAISTVVGLSTDLSSADTVYGAKAYADDKVAELQGNALTGVTINEVSAEVNNNVAVFDISAIVCGGAE